MEDIAPSIEASVPVADNPKSRKYINPYDSRSKKCLKIVSSISERLVLLNPRDTLCSGLLYFSTLCEVHREATREIMEPIRYYKIHHEHDDSKN
jgi:hypothetical protein